MSGRASPTFLPYRSGYMVPPSLRGTARIYFVPADHRERQLWLGPTTRDLAFAFAHSITRQLAPGVGRMEVDLG